jgi:hypothetical protein
MIVRGALVLLGVVALASSAQGGLFAVYIGGAVPGDPSFFELNQTTGERRLVSTLPFRVWGDLAGRPGDNTNAYAVARVPGAAYQNTVSIIHTGSGALSDLYSFASADLGFNPERILSLDGISFSPTQPSTATIAGTLINVSAMKMFPILFDLDMNTGARWGRV